MELYNINCEVDINENIEINDDFTVTQLYRIVQEAVNNAIKHSTADNIIIRLQSDSDGILLSIIDNGNGISSNHTTQGLGMSIMKHRARLIQGTFLTDNRIDEGFTVYVRFSPWAN